jgi:DNA-binding transcriptional regulator YhcF (GntR family)
MSYRTAAQENAVAVNTAKKGFVELIDKGFIKVITKGSFDMKGRHATEYALTEIEYNKMPPTKEYMRYKNKNAVSKID